MSGFKRRRGGDDWYGDPYKRPRPLPLQEDMLHHQGYVGDEPAYRHPPAPHYDYAYPPDHHAYPPDPYEYPHDPHAYPPDPHAYPPDPHAYPPHPDYDYPRPRPARARPPRGRYDYSTVRGAHEARGSERGRVRGRGHDRGHDRGRGGIRGRGRGGEGGKRGRGRGGGDRGGGDGYVVEENPWLAVMNAMGANDEVQPEEEEGTGFTCSQRKATKVLAQLYPDAVFEQTLLIHNELGHCIGYQVKVEGKTFYGEGSTAKIAKGLAALDALTYIKAPGCDDLLPVCDVVEEMKKMELVKAGQEQYGTKKPAGKRGPAKQTFKRQQPKSGLVVAHHQPPVPTLVNFQLLKQKYVGPQNEGELVQTFNPAGSGTRTCVLIVQGHVFKGDGATDKIARDCASKEAIVFFEKTPPKFVQKMKEKTAREPIYDRQDPDDYINLLYCKAWKFAVELTKDHNQVYVRKQNLAFVLKIYGPDQNIDNAEVVAMASGAKIIATEYMSPDGFAINDCGGESLCIRTFRRYLVNQLMNLSKGYKETIFRRNPFGRIMMKEGYKFVFVTNCSSMGDCKNFDAQFYNCLKNKQFFNIKHDGSELKTNALKKTERKKANPSASVPFDTTKCGKLHQYRRMALDHVPDQCVVPEPDILPYLSPVVAPSAKLALRNVVGFQGALLSTLIDNIYFSEFYIGRAFDDVALARALHGRLQGTKFPAGVSVKVPEIHRLTWKPSRMADKTTVYAFAWCEGCTLDVLRADIGSKVDMIKPADIKDIGEDMLHAYDSREIKSASPSQFCSYNYYETFTELLKAESKTVESYTKLKKSATAYQAAKQAVYNAFQQKDLGNWPKKTVLPNF